MHEGEERMTDHKGEGDVASVGRSRIHIMPCASGYGSFKSAKGNAGANSRIRRGRTVMRAR